MTDAEMLIALIEYVNGDADARRTQQKRWRREKTNERLLQHQIDEEENE